MAGEVRIARRAVGLLALVSATACSGGTFVYGDAGAGLEAGDSGALSGDQACTDLATSACARLASCASVLVTLTFGDATTCVARGKLACTESMSATDSGFTPGSTEQCAQAYATASCDEVLAGKLPSTCMVQGTAPAGAACGDGSQCSDGAFCSIPSGQACGVCAPRLASGGSCRAAADCESGLTCAIPTGAKTGSCVAPGASGAACDAQHPCLATLVCNSAGTCVVPMGAGASCKAQDCDTLRGLYCNPLTHVCAQLQSADAGAPCGASLTTGVVTACAAGGHCKLAAASGMGTCEAPAADGASCDATAGPNCLAPAACVNGACTLPAPASCL